MDTSKLKRFAQFARRSLIQQVTSRLNLVLQPESMARREYGEAIADLEKEIKASSKEQVIERVAYVWFNRFCALRFMDVNRYTKIGVLSPAEGQFQPEILAEAKMGHIDEDLVADAVVRDRIFALLNGTSPSPDSQTEAYRSLIVSVCNHFYKAMPYLFDRIANYTELLMPDDLLSGNSILAYTREAMTPDVCKDVEAIGWLYQFYISEKKDEVFDGLKKNRKITPENIPAATQLFTPNWIVRYLVENSLGRLWMLNHPNSRLIEQMEYYIAPEQTETDFLRITKPEDIKICDPACGSGHMLVYAFDLLYAIYEEEGYEPAEIPEKILTLNLFGIEIDERAGELAAFALTMKARAKHRRFFNKGIEPNICVLENVSFADDDVQGYMDFVGRDLFTAPLLRTLHEFEESNNFGSLIRPTVTDVAGMVEILKSKNVEGSLFFYRTHEKVLRVLRQADFLSSKYHVVIANPPYMSVKGMNERMSTWSKNNYPDSKSDLFAMFIERSLELVSTQGLLAMITMQNWMFLSSFEKLRNNLLSNSFIANLIQIGYNSFPELNSKVALACAFVLVNTFEQNLGSYINLNDAPKSADKEAIFIEKKRNNQIYRVTQSDFKEIPGNVIAYWASKKVKEIYSCSRLLSEVADSMQGMITGNNDIFLRRWYEPSRMKLSLGYSDILKLNLIDSYWIPYNKGGDSRKWYGNNEFVLNWKNEGRDLTRARTQNSQFYFKPCITWTFISLFLAARICGHGFVWDVAGSSAFPHEEKMTGILLCLMCSKVGNFLLDVINPTLNYQVENILALPIHNRVSFEQEIFNNLMSLLVKNAQSDWDYSETSWDFSIFPLIQIYDHQSTLEATYTQLRQHWQQITLEMQRLEEENNRIFIEAYGLEEELTPDVPLKEITLTCNPHYRYDSNKSEAELETLLLADTIREFISYAVGCMFGRYSIDKEGLTLANQGETIEDYLQKIPNPSFMPDRNNVIPILEGDWFTDDISEQFRKFLRLTFGEENYQTNLTFIEKALDKPIQKYFLKDFYNDHVKRYKKRPIYWLFSSPKGNFNALIYLHRYRPDTASIVLNDYLREYRAKLTAHKTHLESVSIDQNATQSEKTKALKTIENLRKIIDELEKYERDILYPLASQQLAIELDDGVKVNYVKFGAALKKIAGLDAAED
ncbi:BREX-1 system adenine-specific DNA-methyltransferase PglX [Pseudanabaena galeata UHCC 0370]|uniref:site-specific DNA-methyltransferase (adenine-specific) n=1 Tax=Pseudanabaena galeata UHCC 0370 TaxID=3110310 RepID=A0ABU5TF37_9CYAN|nr:BREX-1 system adenine-specific DNA-methyltransferase PglX [Pseudanabaena galeata]MEA5476742.1 BREX-1 system adenine-specific DNA-methyltransferase PglX [Pseudanabaena galeata UHCC 0370]